MKNNKLHVFLMSLLLACASTLAWAGEVNVNTADAATLAAELDGVGEKIAAAIVAYREEHGAFDAVEELMKVKGIGEVILEKNRERIVLK